MVLEAIHPYLCNDDEIGLKRRDSSTFCPLMYGISRDSEVDQAMEVINAESCLKTDEFHGRYGSASKIIAD